jgi:hypothetical protein
MGNNKWSKGEGVQVHDGESREATKHLAVETLLEAPSVQPSDHRYLERSSLCWMFHPQGHQHVGLLVHPVHPGFSCPLHHLLVLAHCHHPGFSLLHGVISTLCN